MGGDGGSDNRDSPLLVGKGEGLAHKGMEEKVGPADGRGGSVGLWGREERIGLRLEGEEERLARGKGRREGENGEGEWGKGKGTGKESVVVCHC
ncbi:hypothetical protein VNO78_23440 [Psophocarpus tetragonolobus]|uniref:Uncharacterized protein n=1 Tax=Psophocarpus tetragonolobus TaxID=3891 RepID=A0AAN9XDI5_PSOTE